MLTREQALTRWAAGEHPRYRVVKNCDLAHPFAMIEEWADGSQTAVDVFCVRDTRRDWLESEAAALNRHMQTCDRLATIFAEAVS